MQKNLVEMKNFSIKVKEMLVYLWNKISVITTDKLLLESAYQL